VEAAKVKAQTYLEAQVSSTSDVYDLAIVAYALQLAGSQRAQEIWEALDRKAIVEGNRSWSQIVFQ